VYDSTPPPFGDITRRWTHLTDLQRDEHARRLVGVGGCEGDRCRHVDRVVVDDGVCYHRLVPAAAAGDEVAVGWLATTHRPLLIARGRALFEHDPSEWGAVCLELLHTTVATANLAEVRWLRRRVAQQLASRLSKHVARHLDRRRRESPTAPGVLWAAHGRERVQVWETHLDVSLVLDRALEQLDTPTRDAFVALANHEPLAEIADRHGLSHAAVRQRVSRARRRLQPELAPYRRAVA
jgi:hypothetical protein